MSAFFVRRPIVAMVIAIFTVMAGVMALIGLPVAQFPRIIPPQVVISTTYPGADAVTIEQAVATPIEQQMNGVDRMLYIQSTNASDGSMVQRVTFDVDTDVDIANVLVQNRYGQAQAGLPVDVKNTGVTIKKSLAFPLMVLALTSDNVLHDQAFLSNYATININDSLLRVPGVGDVRNMGASDYSMRVWVKPDLLARRGLTIEDLQRAMRAQNVVNPAGQVGAEPAPPGQQFTYTVRAPGRLVTPDDFSAIIVRANPDGSQVRLRDVARVEMGTLFYKTAGSYNGRPAAVIAAYQLPGSNGLEVAAGIQEEMGRLADRFVPGMRHEVVLDTTAPVRAGIEEILITFAEALVLVILVVFVFLQSWRATLIPLLTVPVSLVGALAVFPWLGFSINTLTLFGLVLAIGLVVDDAIVVVEAVEHHIGRGLAPRAATLLAMREVAAPVVAIALVLASVFVPVAFMGGITGRLYQPFALTIAVAVLLSAFNALTLTPALSALLLRPRSSPAGPFGGLGRRFDAALARLTGGCVALCAKLVQRPWATALLLVAAASGAAGAGSSLPTSFIPEEDNGYAVLSAQLPDAASRQRTQEAFATIGAILERQPGVAGYTAMVGNSQLTGTSASYMGSSFISLAPWRERRAPSLHVRRIVADLNRALAEVPDARVTVLGPPAIPGMGAAGGFSMMLQDRGGGTVESLAQAADQFVAAAQKRPELATVAANFAPAVPQIYVDVDKDKVLKQGVELGSVYTTLQAFLGGAYVNDFTRFGRQWKVFVEAEPAYRTEAENLKQFHVRNAQGLMVPLGAFTSIKNTEGPEYTTRFNLYRAVEVVGSAALGASSGQALAALDEVAREVLPEDMGTSYSGLAYQEKRAQGTGKGVFVLSVACVFLVLAALYESWSLPLSILLGTPFALVGAFAGLWARGLDNNVYAQIGLVMLVGLGAKNAILIVEFARARWQQGLDPVAAALEGVRIRLRPILMTSLAFILGCAPLWWAEGAGASSRRTLGTAVIVGMVVSTLVGTFVVPALFVAVVRLAGRRPRPQDAPT